MSVQKPQFAGFLLTANLSDSPFIEDLVIWLSQQFLHLCESDKSFDHIPIYYQDTVMFIDPSTKQAFDYATPIL